MTAVEEILAAGIVVILTATTIYCVVVNMDKIYDRGCSFQQSIHPAEYSKCATCGKARPNKHMTNVRGVGMVCDKHLGLEE